jgi:hypothetical protein
MHEFKTQTESGAAQRNGFGVHSINPLVKMLRVYYARKIYARGKKALMGFFSDKFKKPVSAAFFAHPLPEQARIKGSAGYVPGPPINLLVP